MDKIELDGIGADRGDPITHSIIGAAFEVANTLGHGFLEAVYRKALVYELAVRGLSAIEEVEFKIQYKNNPVGRYLADLIVENSVIVEIKAVAALSPAHAGQTLNYLKASGLRKGLLLNFGTPRLGVQRITR